MRVGFANDHYCAVQLKSNYVLFVYDTQKIRQAFIAFDFESTRLKKIHKTNILSFAVILFLRRLRENTQCPSPSN